MTFPEWCDWSDKFTQIRSGINLPDLISLGAHCWKGADSLRDQEPRVTSRFQYGDQAVFAPWLVNHAVWNPGVVIVRESGEEYPKSVVDHQQMLKSLL